MRALDANFRLCFIIEAISLRLLCNTVLELDTAEDFLQQLRAWVQTLPDDLRLSLNKEESGMSENTDREMSVGNVHVACSYYFGVILTTRQFLVTTITSQIRRQTHRKSGSQELGNQPRGTPESKPVQLASVCGKAATYMVEMCHEAASWDRLLNNMCILQYAPQSNPITVADLKLEPGSSLQASYWGSVGFLKILFGLQRCMAPPSWRVVYLKSFPKPALKPRDTMRSSSNS